MTNITDDMLNNYAPDYDGANQYVRAALEAIPAEIPRAVPFFARDTPEQESEHIIRAAAHYALALIAYEALMIAFVNPLPECAEWVGVQNFDEKTDSDRAPLLALGRILNSFRDCDLWPDDISWALIDYSHLVGVDFGSFDPDSSLIFYRDGTAREYKPKA